MSIPASEIVRVVPGVIGAGGSALDLNGLILTSDTAVPIGTVQSFANARDVQRFFGATSTEATLAGVYFNGFDNSTRKPGSLLFAQYPIAPVAGYLRGGSMATVSLDQLKTMTGTLTVSVDGTAKTSSAINLSAATSFSNAASIIQAAFTTFGATCMYDSQRAAFVITSGTTGATSSVSYGSGTIAAGLKLTQATGAVVSAGAAAGVPAVNMSAITDISQNWASFMTVFEPTTDNKVAFSAWTSAQGDRFAYVGWDTDVAAAQQGSTTSWGARVKASEYSGSILIYRDPKHAAFVLGAIASIDFARTNGRITLAFKSQAGLTYSVTDATTAQTLIANGYNFYGDYATSNDQFRFFYPGQISGNWLWVDTYVNQIWLNAAFQQALMTLLTQVNSVPYNEDGYTLIDAACLDPIENAANFGAIRGGVTLSAQQKAQVNNQAGVDISSTLQTRGWYLQILDATAQVRAARGTPPMTFWYMDGGAVQKINLASLAVL
ncbi:DUF3383 domain-containing protein [Bordetella hinzii]|uniref:DUF3383 domain-containing protein n=1 Tax=Bordetella hinzii TaxID=103855 RepID=UPI00045A2196|nr:DUF3383 domain-containing protein [Bordetella hinzii]KCB33772.1 PF11863 family protein [Bordetella hinzii CA90 BAL1384]MCJ9707661.1 DUF3383 domain-containing protein [Bordetella hinzii]